MWKSFFSFSLLCMSLSSAQAASLYECETQNSIPGVMISQIKIWIEPSEVRAQVDYKMSAKPWSTVSEKKGSDFQIEYKKLYGNEKLIHFARARGGRYSFSVFFSETDGVLTQEKSRGPKSELMDQVFLTCKRSTYALPGQPHAELGAEEADKPTVITGASPN